MTAGKVVLLGERGAGTRALLRALRGAGDGEARRQAATAVEEEQQQQQEEEARVTELEGAAGGGGGGVEAVLSNPSSMLPPLRVTLYSEELDGEDGASNSINNERVRDILGDALILVLCFRAGDKGALERTTGSMLEEVRAMAPHAFLVVVAVKDGGSGATREPTAREEDGIKEMALRSRQKGFFFLQVQVAEAEDEDENETGAGAEADGGARAGQAGGAASSAARMAGDVTMLAHLIHYRVLVATRQREEVQRDIKGFPGAGTRDKSDRRGSAQQIQQQQQQQTQEQQQQHLQDRQSALEQAMARQRREDTEWGSSVGSILHPESAALDESNRVDRLPADIDAELSMLRNWHTDHDPGRSMEARLDQAILEFKQALVDPMAVIVRQRAAMPARGARPPTREEEERLMRRFEELRTLFRVCNMDFGQDAATLSAQDSKLQEQVARSSSFFGPPPGSVEPLDSMQDGYATPFPSAEHRQQRETAVYAGATPSSATQLQQPPPQYQQQQQSQHHRQAAPSAQQPQQPVRSTYPLNIRLPTGRVRKLELKRRECAETSASTIACSFLVREGVIVDVGDREYYAPLLERLTVAIRTQMERLGWPGPPTDVQQEQEQQHQQQQRQQQHQQDPGAGEHDADQPGQQDRLLIGRLDVSLPGRAEKGQLLVHSGDRPEEVVQAFVREHNLTLSSKQTRKLAQYVVSVLEQDRAPPGPPSAR